MNRTHSFRVTEQHDLQDTSIMLLIDIRDEHWTLVSTAQGEDLLIDPRGRTSRLDYGLNEGPIETAVTQALSDWAA